MAIPGLGISGVLGAISIVFLLLINSLGRAPVVGKTGLQDGANSTKQHPTGQVEQKPDYETNGELQAAERLSVEEARTRAKILHEAFGGALLVMHRDYFRDDQRLKQPSLSLEDVFKEMAEEHQIELRWLAVNAIAMNADHKPQNDFEEQAVKALSSGNDEFEMVNENSFQFAGSIPLFTSCLKCHERSRTNGADKKAALIITLPLVENQRSN